MVGEDPAVPGAADLDRVLLSPAVHHGKEVLVPGLHPAQRPAEPAARPGHHDGVPVRGDLGTEATADVRRDDPHLRRVQAERLGHLIPGLLRVLRAGPQGEPTFRPGGGGRADLQRDRGHPLVRERALHHDVAAVERAVRRWAAAGPEHVGPRRRVQHRLIGQRGVHPDYRVQRRVVHVDQFGRVLALIAVLGQHDRDRLPDVAHPVGGQQRLGGRPGRRGQVIGVRRGQHRDHAGAVQRLFDVDAGDLGMCHRAAHERHPERAGQFRQPEIVGIGASGGEQSWVLGPHHPGSQNAHQVSSLPPCQYRPTINHVRALVTSRSGRRTRRAARRRRPGRRPVGGPRCAGQAPRWPRRTRPAAGR